MARFELLGSAPLTYKKEMGGSGAERQKNRNALSALGIRLPNERADWIRRLQPEDYTAGPEPDTYNYPPPGDGPLWQFGLWINNVEVYIKLQMGVAGTPPICVSFHPVEKAPLRYPLRVPRRH
jgi:hypothetical protein